MICKTTTEEVVYTLSLSHLNIYPRVSGNVVEKMIESILTYMTIELRMEN